MANQLVNTFVIIGSKEGFRRIGSATLVAPFASITWSRFNGSPALPRRTLSLCPGSSGPVGSPQDDRKLSWTAKHVKNSSTRQQQGFTKNLLCQTEEIPQAGASTPIATIAPTVLDQIYREIDSPPPKIR